MFLYLEIKMKNIMILIVFQFFLFKTIVADCTSNSTCQNFKQRISNIFGLSENFEQLKNRQNKNDYLANNFTAFLQS